MTEVEKLIEIYRQVEDAGLMVTAGKKDAAELMVSHDVVPVVRCNDCQSREPSNVRGRIWCKNMNRYMKVDGFCSAGERRSDA